MTRQQTVQALLAAQDTAYQAFQSKLVPGQDNILGVRMPCAALQDRSRGQISAPGWMTRRPTGGMRRPCSAAS